MKTYERILRAVYAQPWAIQLEKLDAILAFLEVKASGGFTSAEVLAELRAQNAAIQARAKSATGGTGAVAVIPIYGTVCHRADLFSEYSGGTSCESIAKQLRAALADPAVSAIVLDIDSPGGPVDGIAELADEIYKARGKKPITAIADTLCASAAYWIGCSATQFVCTPSGMVGSIGVYDVHQDLSKALEMAGEKMTFIAAGKYKVERNPAEPLSEEARQAMQNRVDEYYSMFTRAVARGRNAKVEDVRNGFGEGRAVTAQQAVKLGMVDRVATLDEVLAGFGVSRSTSAQAEAQLATPVAERFMGDPQGQQPEPDAIDVPAAPIETEESEDLVHDVNQGAQTTASEAESFERELVIAQLS